MAPTKSSQNPPSSQNKKQQSISSFFTPKSSAAPKAIPKPVPAARPSSPIDNDDDLPHKYVSNHSKRSIDDSLSDGENQEPSPKRARQNPVNVTSNPSRNGLTKDASPILTDVPEDSEARNSSKISSRTSRYIFSSSPPRTNEDDDDGSEESIRRKKALHARFVQKLGAPDSLARLKQNRWNNNDGEGEGEHGEEDDEDEPAPKSTKGKKGGARANGKLTPMEVQFLDIKRKNPDTIIAYQVGYKFRFFGEDARVAAKELGIFCIPGKFRFDERE